MIKLLRIQILKNKFFNFFIWLFLWFLVSYNCIIFFNKNIFIFDFQILNIFSNFYCGWLCKIYNLFLIIFLKFFFSKLLFFIFCIKTLLIILFIILVRILIPRYKQISLSKFAWIYFLLVLFINFFIFFIGFLNVF